LSDFTHVDTIITGYYNNGQQAIIATSGRFAYFPAQLNDSPLTLSNIPPHGITKLNLNTFTVEEFFYLPSPAAKLYSFLKHPTLDQAYITTNETTSSRIFCLGLNDQINTMNYTDFAPPVGINFITYSNNAFDSSSITLINSDNGSLFSTSGGYALLVKYSSSVIINAILIKYTSVSGSTIQNVSLAKYLNTKTSVTFGKIIPIKINDYNSDAYSNGLLYLGHNSISESNDLIPTGSTIISVSGNNNMSRNYYVKTTVERSNVSRALRDTAIASHSAGNSIIRVNNTPQSTIATNITNLDVNISVTDGSLFSQTGFVLLGSELIKYENGYGITVVRGALNTTPASHIASTSYYQYSLSGVSTTLRTGISSVSTHIPLDLGTNPNITNNNQLYLITNSLPLPIPPEIVNNGSWTRSLDIIYKARYNTDNNIYTTLPNTYVYKLASVSAPAKLRSSIDTSTPIFLQLDSDASSYPSQYNSVNYLLVDKEFMTIDVRSSLDGITRNKYNTLSALSTTQVTGLTITSPSFLRQNINSDHLFLPLSNASGYGSSGTVLIDGEWFQYTSKNSLDFNLINRGEYLTTPQNYSYNPSQKIILLNSINAYRNLNYSINTTTGIIPLNGSNSSYNNNGLILIDTEFLQIYSKYSFDDLTRGYLLTSLFSSPGNYEVSDISSVTSSSTIRFPVSSTAKFIPVQYADAGSFSPSGGIGLIDGEFFQWNNKNTLDNLTRGINGTTEINHETDTGVNLVSQLKAYDLDIFGNIVIDNFTIHGDKVLLSDTVSGIRISSADNIEDFPPSGVITINNEKILYESNKTLADISRGTNSTSAASYSLGTYIYLIDTSINLSLTTSTLSNSIVSGSTQITVSSVSGFSSSGTIIINSEIISYTGILGNTLTGCLRGRYSSTPANHNALSTIYLIPVSTVIRSSIIQNMNIDDLIVPLDNVSQYPTEGTVLIGSEIMIYRSKNAIGKLTRGYNSTTPKGYYNGTTIVFTNIVLTDQNSTILVDTATGDVRVDLPSAVDVTGRIYTIKKIDANNQVIITPYDSETIDDQSTLVITSEAGFASIQSDGSDWKIILRSDYEPVGSAATAKAEAIVEANQYTDTQIATVVISNYTTDDLNEGTTNLYFTTQRVIDATTGLYDPVGSAQNALNTANSYTDNAITNITLDDFTTDDLDEGTTNKYFTNQRVIDATTGLYDPVGSADSALTDANFYTDLVAANINGNLDDKAAILDPTFSNNISVTGSIFRTVSNITQLISLTTPVTINSNVGIIQLYSASITTGTVNEFVVNNNIVSNNDVIFTQVISSDTGATSGTLNIAVKNITSGGFSIIFRNITGSTISGTNTKISFMIVKAI
jgi:hypothetical protein